MQIGTVGKRVGLSVDAIRFYERNALLPRAPRTLGGFRQYSESDVETLNFIGRVQNLGFTLKEVRDLLDLRRSRLQPCAPVRRRLEEKLADIQRKVSDLQKLEHELRLALRSCKKGDAQTVRSLPNSEQKEQQRTGECRMRVEKAQSAPNGSGSGALLAGGLAAILASTCCLGPLFLVALGLSGAWIGNLTRLEPYRPFFIAGALVSLFFAARRIFRAVPDCRSGEMCAVPGTRRIYKIVFGIVAALVLVALVFPYVARFFY
jgi:mercuric ion transport protein